MRTIYIVGDSTVENGSDPYYGWGGQLAPCLPKGYRVYNAAIGGRSSLSFWDEGRFVPIESAMEMGDLLLVAFGHNDEKDDAKRHTDPATTFPAMLLRYVSAARNAGAVPVLLTSVCRRYFVGDGSLLYTHGEYPATVRQMAAREGIPLIDLKAKTRAWLRTMGPEESARMFVSGDNTHFNQEGAGAVARMVSEGLGERGVLR